MPANPIPYAGTYTGVPPLVLPRIAGLDEPNAVNARAIQLWAQTVFPPNPATGQVLTTTTDETGKVVTEWATPTPGSGFQAVIHRNLWSGGSTTLTYSSLGSGISSGPANLTSGSGGGSTTFHNPTTCLTFGTSGASKLSFTATHPCLITVTVNNRVGIAGGTPLSTDVIECILTGSSTGTFGVPDAETGVLIVNPNIAINIDGFVACPTLIQNIAANATDVITIVDSVHTNKPTTYTTVVTETTVSAVGIENP